VLKRNALDPLRRTELRKLERERCVVALSWVARVSVRAIPWFSSSTSTLKKTIPASRIPTIAMYAGPRSKRSRIATKS